MRIIILSAALLAGCGSFPLGTVYPQREQTATQREADMLVCKDRARIETDTDARVAGSFLAGLTIVGAPIAIESAKSKARDVFAACMEARGYRVVRPS